MEESDEEAHEEAPPPKKKARVKSTRKKVSWVLSRSDEHATKNAQDEQAASPRAKSEETRAQRVNPSREQGLRRTGCAERAADERAANKRAASARAAYASRVLGVKPSIEHAAKNTPCCSELAALNPSRRTRCERTSPRAHAALNPRLEHAAQNRLRRTRSASRERGHEARACLKPSLAEKSCKAVVRRLQTQANAYNKLKEKESTRQQRVLARMAGYVRVVRSP